MPKSDHLWDEQEAARYLGVTNYAIRKWRNLGKIGVIKVGSLNRYDPQEIKAFAERHREHPICRNCSNSIPQKVVLLPNEVPPDTPIYATG